MPTRYSLHVERWSNCTACDLRHGRKNVVLSRGKIPCDILLIGEAPGKSEDSLGAPFVGPAGHLLDEIVSHSCRHQRVAFTNMISCIPLDPDDNSKLEEPPEWAIEACQYRLQEFIEIADPKLIVQVGRVASDFLTPGYRWSIPLHREIPMCHIDHPSYILRLKSYRQGPAVQRAVMTILDALKRAGINRTNLQLSRS